MNNNDFYISEIPDDIFEKMQGKSYKENCTVPREELRYIHILHIGFDGKTHEGELIVNKRIADAVLDIFAELYKAEYRIEKVRLIDEYNAEDELSMRDNNSSAFNFRYYRIQQSCQSMHLEWQLILILFIILISKRLMEDLA